LVKNATINVTFREGRGSRYLEINIKKDKADKAMSKCKETVNIEGEIVKKYEVIKLNNDLSKQRFLLRTEEGAKYFITAFGNEYILMLCKFNDGDKVSLNAGKEVTTFNGKEHINYYVNSIDAMSKCKVDVYFQKYIDFFDKNKIDHSLTIHDVEVVFKELVKSSGISIKEFDSVLEFMIKKWRNNLYFHLKTKEKLQEYYSTALKLKLEEEN
jgi:hypothetical protein